MNELLASNLENPFSINDFLKGYAFIIAINNYRNLSNKYQLKTPISDANSLKILLETQGFIVKSIQDCDLESFTVFVKEIQLTVVNDNCRVLVYFAGHGEKDYLLPADAKLDDLKTWLDMEKFLYELEILPCHHLLLILDCCYAGSIRWANKDRYNIPPEKKSSISHQHFIHFIKRPSWQVLVSASQNQFAWDRLFGDPEVIHSPFAKYLLEGLRGAADFTKNGIVTATKLHMYIQEKMTIVMGEQSLTQNTGLYPLNKHENGEFLFFMQEFNKDKLPVLSKTNPYKGLESYNPEDAPLFFGRKEAADKIYNDVNSHSFVLIRGESGVGKSSLVKAGVVPGLEKLGNQVKIIRPGRNPLVTLQQAGNFDVLVVDQFEELLTQAEQNESEQFCIKLIDVIQKGKKVIATVRSDFENDIQKLSAKLYQQSFKTSVSAFTIEDFRDIIVCPASRCGRFYYPEMLIGVIIEEVRYRSKALPLLSFALHELFELAKNDLYREITFDDYQNLGGISGSLRKKADELYEKLNDEQRRTMKNMMLRMVNFSAGEYFGKQVITEDFEFGNKDENRNVKVVEKALLEARLVVKGKDNDEREFLEPTHDALIREWDKLRTWIKKSDEIIPFQIQNALSNAVVYYKTEKKKERLWHNDERLTLLKNQLKAENRWLNKLECEFIEKSIALKWMNRLFLIVFTFLAFLSISIFASIAYYQGNIAKENLRLYKFQEINKLLLDADAFSKSGHFNYMVSSLDSVQSIKNKFFKDSTQIQNQIDLIKKNIK